MVSAFLSPLPLALPRRTAPLLSPARPPSASLDLGQTLITPPSPLSTLVHSALPSASIHAPDALPSSPDTIFLLPTPETPALALTKAVLALAPSARIVLLSLLGAGDSEASIPAQVAVPFRSALLELSHAEAALRAAGPAHTVVRAVPLDDDVAGAGSVTESIDVYGTVSRAAVAEALVRVAGSETARGKTLTVFDRERLLVTAPYVRPLESWESVSVEDFDM